jgi:hypothetical protein
MHGQNVAIQAPSLAQNESERERERGGEKLHGWLLGYVLFRALF